MMYTSDAIAAYFLSHDDWDMFCGYFENTIDRTNTFLQLAQNLYVTDFGKLLFSPDIYAEEKGVVCNGVEEHYDSLFSDIFMLPEHITQEDRTWLERFIDVFRCMPTEELRLLSEEDPARLARMEHKTEPLDPLAHREAFEAMYRPYLDAMEKVDLEVAAHRPW